MELRQELRRVPTRPIVLVITILAVLALGLTAWYTLVSIPSPQPGTTVTSGFPGPDARDRNQQIQQGHEKDPEATHGH